ncbi:Unknown protein, partial [Striga hermonthica]
TIRDLAYSLENLERTDETRVQLPSLSESHNSANRTNSEKGWLANLELNVSSMMISGRFLSTLSCPESLPDQLDLLRCLLDHLRTEYSPLSDVVPIKRGTTLATIKCLVRSHLNGRMIAVVIRELGYLAAELPRPDQPRKPWPAACPSAAAAAEAASVPAVVAAAAVVAAGVSSDSDSQNVPAHGNSSRCPVPYGTLPCEVDHKSGTVESAAVSVGSFGQSVHPFPSSSSPLLAEGLVEL